MRTFISHRRSCFDLNRLEALRPQQGMSPTQPLRPILTLEYSPFVQRQSVFKHKPGATDFEQYWLLPHAQPRVQNPAVYCTHCSPKPIQFYNKSARNVYPAEGGETHGPLSKASKSPRALHLHVPSSPRFLTSFFSTYSPNTGSKVPFFHLKQFSPGSRPSHSFSLPNSNSSANPTGSPEREGVIWS